MPLPQHIQRKPPLPTVQSFLTCQEVFRGQRSGTTILLGPVAHVPATQFPGSVRLSVFAEFVGGHGNYQPALNLRDGSGQIVWGWPTAAPFNHSDPMLPTEVVFSDLLLAVPRPGRYTLELLLNGDHAAERTMWFGPTATFVQPIP